MIHRVGNGCNTSVWFDIWHPSGPLNKLISRRRIIRARFSLQASVADVISNGAWKWPVEWMDRYGFLFECSPPVLDQLKSDIVL